MKKRVCALLLTACIAVGLMLQFPVTAAAAESVPLPTATVTNISGEVVDDHKLDFALIFEAVEPTEEQKAAYKDWLADFELTISEDVRGKDGLLAGQYDGFSPDWLVFEDNTMEDVLFRANEPVPIVQTFAGFMGYQMGEIPYEFIYEYVKVFKCGLSLKPEFWEAHPDATVELALKVYNPQNKNESYSVGNTYVFTKGATEPHICVKSNWQRNDNNHYKTECLYAGCPLKGNLKFFNQGAHTFGADNTCTVCGYLRDTEKTAAPETGDTTHTLLWATLFVGGVAMMWMQLNARKRETF